ncbi:hypothetical protein INT47_008359 [Mucor saturninus]|uniref:Uncharacterized protein n=1 Tax=Mucor saturninus TaxID=64648 RepID=A0A8H7RFH3_9FUNG|nr:hypothetical protein INT47_008359 [Mucor saturninus]
MKTLFSRVQQISLLEDMDLSQEANKEVVKKIKDTEEILFLEEAGDVEEDSHSPPTNNQPRTTIPVPRNPVPTKNYKNHQKHQIIHKPQKQQINMKTQKHQNQHYTITQDGIAPGGRLHHFVGQLETTDNTSMAVVGYRSGLQITIPVQPSPIKIETNSIFSHRSTSSRQCSRKIQDSSSDKEIAQPRSELLIPVLYDKRTEQNLTNFRLSYNQPISSMPTFQDGRSVCSQRNSRGWRLYGKDRFEGCIYGGTNQSKIPKIPHISSSRYSLPISIPPFWIECSPEVVFKTDEVCSGTIEEKGVFA